MGIPVARVASPDWALMVMGREVEKYRRHVGGSHGETRGCQGKEGTLHAVDHSKRPPSDVMAQHHTCRERRAAVPAA
jgi:hypothetical protein